LTTGLKNAILKRECSIIIPEKETDEMVLFAGLLDGKMVVASERIQHRVGWITGSETIC